MSPAVLATYAFVAGSALSLYLVTLVHGRPEPVLGATGVLHLALAVLAARRVRRP